MAENKGTKANNYDTTGNVRAARRIKRIKDSDLVERKVIMDIEDAEKIRKYAQTLYKKRGKTLIPFD